jgi:hypothetical protein
MGLVNWIFDIYQHSRIDSARREAAEARAEAARVAGAGGRVDVARLEQALGELALSVKTLQRVIVEKRLCTSDELARRLREIDLEDGRADGKTSLP